MTISLYTASTLAPSVRNATVKAKTCFRDAITPLVTALLAAGVLLASDAALSRWDLAPWWRVVIGAAPAPFFVLVLWTIVRNIHRLDELQRKVMLDSVAIGFAGGWIVSLLYDHLAQEADLGLPPMDNASLRALLVIAWIGAYVIAASRYR